MLKNLSLSRNRIGIVTNSKHFKIEHFGIPCSKNDRIFGFLCMLVTPESKEDLNADVRALGSFDADGLQLVLKLNKSNLAYFIDLEKLSTHIREYSAITHLYDTEVAPFVYNPLLIDKHQFDMISESEREMLGPILGTLQQAYNQTQFQSIREMVLRQSGIVLLQGPPGTGKTTTLMGLLAAEFEYLRNVFTGDENKRKIMICAPSNAAVDHITKRLVCEGLLTHRPDESLSLSFLSNTSGINEPQQKKEKMECDPGLKKVFPKVLRVGIVESKDPDILSVSLDEICDREADRIKNKIIKHNSMTSTQVKQKIISISKEINRISSQKGLSEMESEFKINSLRNEIKRYETMLYNFRREKVELKQTYAQIERKLFEEADIVLTTLSSSGSERLEKIMGSVASLIVDEAAQATEPNLLIPFQTGVRKVLLIGDPCQLPSTTLSQDSSMTLFNRSLFQRFLDAGVKPYFLNIQYRMAPLIRQFPSSRFYGGRLRDAQSIHSRYDSSASTLTPICDFFGRNSLFIDVKFGEEENHNNSYRNIAEATVIKEFLVRFLERTKLSIGVITPYQSQRKYLMRELKKQIASLITEAEAKKPENERKQVEEGQWQEKEEKASCITPFKDPEEILNERVMINTVDSFQGQEKDIIIVSTVRANDRRDIGFMKDERRANVALTRSRHLMIVVGHGDTLGSNETWNAFCEWTEKNNTYYTIKNRESLKCVLEKVQIG